MKFPCIHIVPGLVVLKLLLFWRKRKGVMREGFAGVEVRGDEGGVQLKFIAKRNCGKKIYSNSVVVDFPLGFVTFLAIGFLLWP